ncbi:MAG: hypothetical protein QW177_05665 [Candidatus Nitrosotenuis sp.]
MLKIAALLTVSVLLSVVLITAIEGGQFAEAKKADVKQQRHKYSYWVGNKVCGDKLCDGSSYQKWNLKYRIFKSPYDTYAHEELLKIKTKPSK